MAVKIVTDSSADIPASLVRELEIEVVPLYVNFGEETYRAGVDLANEQFFRLLHDSPIAPTTTAPPTALFEQTYRRLSQRADAIISLHLSGHLSTVWKAAANARERLPVSLARIEVIDSRSASLGMGLTVIAAARMAQEGATFDEIMRVVQYRVQHTHSVFFVDNAEFLERSGRLSGGTFGGSITRIKPLLLVNEGLIVPYERTRTRAKAIDGLYTFVEDFPGVREIAVMHSTTPDDVNKLLDKLALIFPRDQVLVGEYDPALGTHLGPGAMGVAAYEG